MDPTLRQLKTFLAIAHAGHVTRAARQLNLTQPAVTHQIRQLEEAVGAGLFRRDGRRVVLTPEGDALLAELTPVIGSLDAMLTRFRRRRPLAGLVRIATLQSYNASLVVMAAADLARQHPGIHLVSREMPADAIEAAIVNGQADIGLTFQARRHAGLRTENLAREHLFAVAATGTARTFGKTVGLATLQRFPLALMPREFALRALIDDAASTLGLTLRVAFESSNLSALIAYACKTDAVAIIPRFAAAGEAGKLVVRQLEDDVTRQLSAITTAGERSDIVKTVIAALAAAIAAQTHPPPAKGKKRRGAA